MAEKEKRVLDVLDYDEIKDVPFVQIFAGVGSGKSYFLERFIKGDSEHHIPKKKILIITSRKAKVVQTLANANLNIGDTQALSH